MFQLQEQFLPRIDWGAHGISLTSSREEQVREAPVRTDLAGLVLPWGKEQDEVTSPDPFPSASLCFCVCWVVSLGEQRALQWVNLLHWHGEVLFVVTLLLLHLKPSSLKLN